MAKAFKLSECDDLHYYGNSDLLAQLSREIQCRPDSCIAKDVISWYNSLYSEGDFDDCRYRVDIENQPSTLEDGIEFLVSLVSGQNRRLAAVSLRIICREAQRRVIEELAPGV